MSILLERVQDQRPEQGFPMPGDSLLGRIVVASVYYTDDIVTLLLIEKASPFFTVAHYHLRDIPVTGSLGILARQYNIVPAVEAYKDAGGDY